MKKDLKNKIKSIEELASISAQAKAKGKKVVLCHGVFDLLHPGHIRHFIAAKRMGDILLVTVTADSFVNKGPGRPVFGQDLRAESVAAIESVDFVGISHWPTAVELIKKIKPNIYVKGSDYAKKEQDLTGKIYEEEEAVRKIGGQIRFTDEISFSSSNLINSFLSPYPEEAKAFLSQFKAKYSADTIISSLKGLSEVSILVIGDIIIDEYHYCLAIGKSQKDNIIATRYINEEVFAGGVLGAANHLASFLPRYYPVELYWDQEQL
jgi:rfaE bifunctional protein nucleotidyltransferase chain/domain